MRLGWISVAAMAGGLGYVMFSMTGHARIDQWAAELPAVALAVRVAIGG